MRTHDGRAVRGTEPAVLTYRFDVLRGVWARLRRLLDQNRVFVPLVAVVVLVLVLVFTRVLTTGRVFFPSAPSSQAPVASPKRTPAPLEGPAPNVVVIVANDQRADDVRFMPNVQKLLAGHGVTFTNAFSTTPLGSPARATLLTGQESFKTGVWDNDEPDGGIFSFRHKHTIATWLRQRGFNTSYVGTYLGGYEEIDKEGFVPPGWDDWHAYVSGEANGYFAYTLDENGKLATFGPQGTYITDVLSNRVTSFIDRARIPFFAHLASHSARPPAPPAPRDARAFRNAPALRPASYNVQASGNSPAAELPKLSGDVLEYLDQYRTNMLASSLSLDRAVARIVDAVDRRGQLDNTVFIYTADKGVLLGEHRIFNVTWPYEEAIRVPLIVRVPWLNEGVTDDHLVTNADITPTIGELTGVRTRIAQDGLSFAPLLHREQIPWREEVRLSYLGEQSLSNFPPRYRAIRTDRYKLVVYDDRSRELFDLLRDPGELNNLAGTEAASKIEEPLFERLEKLIRKFPARIQELRTFPPSPGPEPDESQD